MSLYLNRHGESSHLFHRRKKRVYSIDDDWYFTVRRGYDQGPYPTECVAHQALVDFVQQQIECENCLTGN